MFLVYTFLHHILGCDIWEFLFFLIQDIHTGIYFVIIVIVLFCISALLHHSWGYDIWEFYFTLFRGIKTDICFSFIVTIEFLIFALLHLIFWYKFYFIFEEKILSCSYYGNRNHYTFKRSILEFIYFVLSWIVATSTLGVFEKMRLIRYVLLLKKI